MHVNRTPRIAFVTLGCAKNEVDTDKMQARLAAAGFSIVDDANDADLVIVNTCAFLASAVEEGLEVIFDLVGRENAAGRELKVLVAGCMPARTGREHRLADVEHVRERVEVDDERRIACVCLYRDRLSHLPRDQRTCTVL